MTDYHLSLHNLQAPGVTVWDTDVIRSVTYSLNANDVTEMEVSFSSSIRFPPGTIGRYTTAKLWRRPRGMSTFYVEGDSEWLLTKHISVESKDGNDVRLTFAHPNVFLQRRLVAYKQDTLYADKTFENGNDGQTAALMLAYFDENLGHLCEDVNRRINGIDRKIAYGPVLDETRDYSAPWRNLLTVLQELSGYKEDDVTRFYFRLALVDGQMRFSVQPYYLGRDLSEYVTFGTNFSNIDSIEFTEDYGREINMCYAGGEGSGIEQFVEQVYQKLPLPIFLSEGFESMGDIDVSELLHDHGLRYLARNRAKRLIKARVRDVGAFLYGRNYNHGDLVGLAIDGQAYKCHVYAVSVNASDTGEEVEIFLEAEDTL